MEELLAQTLMLSKVSIKIKLIKLTKEDNGSLMDSKAISTKHHSLSLDNSNNSFDGLLVVFPDNNSFVCLTPTLLMLKGLELGKNEHITQKTKYSKRGPVGVDFF